MKVNWGWITLKDFGGGGTKDNPFVIQILVNSQYNDKNGAQKTPISSFAYMTPKQARRIAQKLLQLAKKKA